jgi:hypothetical protein
MRRDLDFGWHAAKAVSNAAKHGVTFPDATRIFLDPVRTDVSTARPKDGEDRRKVTGRMGAKLYTVVYVWRVGGLIWLISARRANRAEERNYGAL